MTRNGSCETCRSRSTSRCRAQFCDEIRAIICPDKVNTAEWVAVARAAHALGLPPGGEARLAWDLAWTLAAGLAAVWTCARIAPGAPRRHAALLGAAMMAIATWAVIELGGDFPGWFGAGLLIGTPLAVWLGTVVALRGRAADGRASR